MRLVFLFAFTLATFMTPVGAAEAVKLPPKAQEAMDKLEKSEGKLTAEHKKAINTERTKKLSGKAGLNMEDRRTGERAAQKACNSCGDSVVSFPPVLRFSMSVSGFQTASKTINDLQKAQDDITKSGDLDGALVFASATKLTGDTHDAGKNSINATKQLPTEK